MHTPFITIDTDNAVIRFYRTRAATDGLSEVGIAQLKRDLTTLAQAVSHVTGCEFGVEVVE